MTSIQWLGSALLILIGAISMYANWKMVICHFRFKSRGSMIPVIGGLCAGFGFLAAPSPTISFFWWLPPFIDPGCIPMVVAALGYVAWKSIKRES
jgi:hypothetical protein